jgi:hypothetical protein
MKYVITIAVSSSVSCLVDCASIPPITLLQAIRPAPTEHADASGMSTIEFYSSRVRTPPDLNQEEFLWNNDFGNNYFLHEPSHRDYTSCTNDGTTMQPVREVRGRYGAPPDVVSLAPGRHIVKTEARDFVLATMPTGIEPGTRTLVNLQRGRKRVPERVTETDLVLTWDSQVFGWRAKGSTSLDSQ